MLILHLQQFFDGNWRLNDVVGDSQRWYLPQSVTVNNKAINNKTDQQCKENTMLACIDINPDKVRMQKQSIGYDKTGVA